MGDYFFTHCRCLVQYSDPKGFNSCFPLVITAICRLVGNCGDSQQFCALVCKHSVLAVRPFPCKMLVIVTPTFGSQRFSVDVDYNCSVENLLVQCSLKVSDVPITEMQVAFNGKVLASSSTLDREGVAEGATVELRQRPAGSCCLLL